MINKKIKYITLIIILLIMVLGLSFSYAIWRKSKSQDTLNNINSLKCLSTTLTDETSSINLTGEYAIPDTLGMEKDPYRFRIVNNCNTYLNVSINLDILSNTNINLNHIKVSLNYHNNPANNSQKLSSYPAANPTVIDSTSRNIKSNILIFPHGSATYDLRIWIDEETTAEQGLNKTFESKIIVNYQPISDPNHLTINIPNSDSGVFETNSSDAMWNIRTKSLEIFDINQNSNIDLNEVEINSTNLANRIISLSGTQQGNGSISNELGYRYQGPNPNNYILFNGELWRIIGVFDSSSHGKTGSNLVKIIRSESIGALTWNKRNVNNWSESSLKELLNNDYYTGKNETINSNCYTYGMYIKGNCDFTRNGITNNYYRDMIELVTWKIGSASSDELTSNDMYVSERSSTVYNSRPVTDVSFVGLMYPSDYGLSIQAGSCPRTTLLSNYNTSSCAGNSWLLGQGYEWTLTPISDSSSSVLNISDNGYINKYESLNGFTVRPVIYLKSNVSTFLGTGSLNDPYVIIK